VVFGRKRPSVSPLGVERAMRKAIHPIPYI